MSQSLNEGQDLANGRGERRVPGRRNSIRTRDVVHSRGNVFKGEAPVSVVQWRRFPVKRQERGEGLQFGSHLEGSGESSKILVTISYLSF